MKTDGDDRIVAVDFGGYAFLPPSWFEFALKFAGTNFALRVAAMLDYPAPPHENVEALVSASCALAPRGTNKVGAWIPSLFSFSYEHRGLIVLHRGPEAA